jgi:hypothetical protein
MCEPPERLGHELVMLVVAAVHRPRALACLPESVLLGSDGGQLGQHVFARPPPLRQRPADSEASRIGISVHNIRLAMAYQLECGTEDAANAGPQFRAVGVSDGCRGVACPVSGCKTRLGGVSVPICSRGSPAAAREMRSVVLFWGR